MIPLYHIAKKKKHYKTTWLIVCGLYLYTKYQNIIKSEIILCLRIQDTWIPGPVIQRHQSYKTIRSNTGRRTCFVNKISNRVDAQDSKLCAWAVFFLSGLLILHTPNSFSSMKSLYHQNIFVFRNSMLSTETSAHCSGNWTIEFLRLIP